ncbi:MAG: hypothetical protein ACE5GD_07630 [Candidatus Geothermarchaeales archaeon]
MEEYHRSINIVFEIFEPPPREVTIQPLYIKDMNFMILFQMLIEPLRRNPILTELENQDLSELEAEIFPLENYRIDIDTTAGKAFIETKWRDLLTLRVIKYKVLH